MHPVDLSFAFSTLEKQPESAAHDGVSTGLHNLFYALGSRDVNQSYVILQEESRGRPFKPSMLVDFGDFYILVQVASHKHMTRFMQRLNKIKQVLAYAAGMEKLDKPLICVVASNREFVAMNPNSFRLDELLEAMDYTAPSLHDQGGSLWVEEQRATKRLKIFNLKGIQDMGEGAFVQFLRGIAQVVPEALLMEESIAV